MAEFVKETDRGRTLYLIKMDEMISGTVAYMDITQIIRSAEQADKKRGYGTRGPAVGIEVARAVEYADWVNVRASSENLHEFNTRDGYLFFTKENRQARPPKAPRRKGQKNAGPNVSIQS